MTSQMIRDAVAPRIFWGTGGEVFKRVVTDSRRAAEGDLFVALSGTRFNGDDFAAEAFKRGCAGVVTSRLVRPEGKGAIFVVDDTTAALMQLGAACRERTNAPVFAVTGSTGKTTTKDMLAHILSKRFNTHRAEKSFNNRIGVSLTLLALEKEHEAVVMEIGSNAPGEVIELAGLARPNVGVITNVGRAHLAGFGSEKGVAKEKESLLAALQPGGTALQPGGTAVLNMDNRHTREAAERFRGKVVTFGRKKGSDYRITGVKGNMDGVTFDVNGAAVNLSILGTHNAYNAAAAIAAAGTLGVDVREAADALREFKSPDMRLETTHVRGVVFLNDTFNANPDSMKAALDTLGSLETKGRRVAVLGDMLELGAYSERHHRTLARVAIKSGVDVLVCVGDESIKTADEARRQGAGIEVAWLPDASNAALYLAPRLESGDVVLVKGSRSVKLDDAVRLLADLVDTNRRFLRRSA